MASEGEEESALSRAGATGAGANCVVATAEGFSGRSSGIVGVTGDFYQKARHQLPCVIISTSRRSG